ncbi:MAG: MBL fold metallo-hydrolase [bacterium]|nr:MBL fold metallo-hydrolase [bacterium]
MKITTLVLGELQTNCYLVSDNDEALIIDPADSPEFIAEKIERLNLRPCAVIATHGHFDHILAAAGLQIIFNIPFLINKNDLPIVSYMQKSAGHWLGRKIPEPVPVPDKFVKENDIVIAGGIKLKVLETSGHTPGSICLYDEKESVLFCGDLLSKDYIGRTDFPYGDAEKIKSSLARIFLLPVKTTIYPGHGESFCLEERGLSLL